ncbi:ATP-binding protein [Sporomusa aerivorans]|uniref:sensor histidine kinase n=1 Tax=Sporomusa aerivorans TaxID=204936 RepID=UPI00352BB1FD
MPQIPRLNVTVCKIVFTYLLVSFIWIFASDELVRMIAADPATFRNLSVIKGWVFVLVTAALLYIQITRYIRLIETKEAMLTKRNEELTDLSDKLCCQLQETQSHEEELKLRNQELDQFAYVVSHDLKAPLRAITNLSAWIEEDLKDDMPASIRDNMLLLRKRVYRMENLIQGILEYSRIGRITGLIELCNIPVLLAEILDDLHPPDNFYIEIDQNIPAFITDSLRLRQVFTNLIDNSIKHHDKPAGRIRVGVTDLGNAYEFSVSDNGPGIAAQYHEKIFEIFQVLKPRDSTENTGVGLALVKKIVENQGGKIRVHSVEAHGTTMYFTWPKCQG